MSAQQPSFDWPPPDRGPTAPRLTHTQIRDLVNKHSTEMQILEDEYGRITAVRRPPRCL